MNTPLDKFWHLFDMLFTHFFDIFDGFCWVGGKSDAFYNPIYLAFVNDTGSNSYQFFQETPHAFFFLNADLKKGMSWFGDNRSINKAFKLARLELKFLIGSLSYGTISFPSLQLAERNNWLTMKTISLTYRWARVLLSGFEGKICLQRDCQKLSRLYSRECGWNFKEKYWNAGFSSWSQLIIKIYVFCYPIFWKHNNSNMIYFISYL